MQVVRREWFNVSRSDAFTIVPLGDVHLGNAACDERLFRSVVQRVADDPTCYWLGMGDYCEFINRSDPRFDVDSLAKWMRVKHLADLAKAQVERFLDIVEPIAGKCLALVEGNHERALHKYYERNVYSEIVTGVKDRGGFEPEDKLAIGYYGWLLPAFYRSDERLRSTRYKVNLHHGFVGGKLAGAKALNMQRWLWTHEADLVLFGHSHNAGTQVETVEKITYGGAPVEVQRIGAYTGSFMTGANYAESKGYFPLPTSRIEIRLRPGAQDRRQRLTVVSGL